jgi:hypothetical protein
MWLLTGSQGKASRLSQSYPKVRLSQDRMPVVPPPLATKLGKGASWARGKDRSH